MGWKLCIVAARLLGLAMVVPSLTLTCSAADPIVSNVTVVQRPGTKLVDVGYDLQADGEVDISVTISGDAGATWTVPASSLAGAVGTGIVAGTGKAIVWDGGADWAGGHTAQGRVQVTASVPAPETEFAVVPAGTNSGTDPDFGAYSLTVSPFYMGRTEVTKATWDAVRAWGLTNGYTDLPAGGGKGQNHPVHTVSWYDVVKWCNARSAKEGRTPCYTVSGSVYKTGESDSVACVASGSGYRLPTDTEWEYAARGGVLGKRFPWGDTITHSQANYQSSSSYSYDISPTRGYHPDYDDGVSPYTSPVGVFAANNYGLHDMVGNLYEWCWDWHPDYVGSYRVERGGCWGSLAPDCRSAFRYRHYPDNRLTDYGFRVCYTTQEEYLVVDLAAGPAAASYPVSYLAAVPAGGWTAEYKTSKLVLRRLPAGTFTMGSPAGELGHNSNAAADETQHQVTLTKDLYVGVFEVTQKQWERAMGTWPSYFSNATYRDTRPVEGVSYNDVRGSTSGAAWPVSNSVDATSFMGILRQKTGVDFDLPTAAQWEYACRAGTTTALNSGKNLTAVGSCPNMAEVGRYWYNGGSGYTQGGNLSVGTAAVGSYLPNAWGLYDMHGNIWEWCLDWLGSYSGTVTDPGGAAGGSDRVVRGGRWETAAVRGRSASRYGRSPAERTFRSGFRLVRAVP